MIKRLMLFGTLVFLAGWMCAAERAVVYLDASQSMRAYMSSTHPEWNSYQDLIIKLNGLLVSAGYSENQLRLVGSGVGAPLPIGNIHRYGNTSLTAAAYVESETNLVGALGAISKEPADLQIIITDAVLSKASAAGSGDCSAGYDLGCFMTRFAEIIDKGWAVTALGVNSWFKGFYYSEDLKSRGAKSSILEARSGLFRPFYIFVISMSERGAAKFTDAVKAWFDGSFGKQHEELILRASKIHPYEASRARLVSDMPRFLRDDRDVGVFTRPEGESGFKHTGKKMRGDFLLFPLEIEFLDYDTSWQHVRVSDHFRVEGEFSFTPSLRQGKDYVVKHLRDAGKHTFQVFLSRDFADSLSGRVTLAYRIYQAYQAAPIDIWQDWSTLNDSLEEDLGKTLNISPLLGFLLDRSLRLVKMTPSHWVEGQIYFAK